MACASSCKTQDHASYGACLKSKRVATTGLETTDPSFSMTRQKKWDKELDAYEAAVRQGVQPEGTTMPKIEKAMRASEATGQPYRADLA
jgi:hypothetical protein